MEGYCEPKLFLCREGVAGAMSTCSESLNIFKRAIIYIFFTLHWHGVAATGFYIYVLLG